MSLSSITKSVFSFRKWPFYISHLYLKYIQPGMWARNQVIVGKNTLWLGFPIVTNLKGATIEVGDDCLICSLPEYTALGVSHKTIIRTLNNRAKIKIGNNVRMSGATICAASVIEIGERCVIGADAIISDTNFHSLQPEIRSSPQDSEKAISKPIRIGNDVFIGGRSIILKGVVLGDKVVVGAGSVVTKSFPEGAIIAGNPAAEVGNIIKA